MGAIRIQGNQENKEMEGPPWEKKKKKAMWPGKRGRNWASPYPQMEYGPRYPALNPRPFRTSCSIYCNQKTTSSATKVTPQTVWGLQLPILSSVYPPCGSKVPFQTGHEIWGNDEDRFLLWKLRELSALPPQSPADPRKHGAASFLVWPVLSHSLALSG